MRTLLQRRKSLEGGVLIIGLIVAGILCASLLSYLSLVHQQNMSVSRSQAWNQSLAIAEAGVEEALAQLNPGVPTFTNLLARNGWSLSDGFYRPGVEQRTLVGMTTNGYYTVKYTATTPPTIYAEGYAPVPATGQYVKRSVEVKTKELPIFWAPIVARSNITFTANGLATDSYNSADPAHSTPDGRYNPATALPNGDVASTYGIVGVGNRTINGKLYLGAAASLDINKNGLITGGIVNDFNMEFPDVTLPDNFSPIQLQPNTSNKKAPEINAAPAYYIGAGDYYIDSLSLKSGEVLYVTSPNARLWIKGAVDMKNGSTIVITTNNGGGNIQMFVAGPAASFGKINVTGKAANFQIYGLPTLKDLTYNANDNFVGTVYAPEATFTYNGSGNSTYDIQGALMVNAIKINGGAQIHYDENLPKILPVRGYGAASWKEL